MTQITKNALADSLKKQMQITPLAKITINDIVNECGLTRRTLYYYFHDVYDLLEWIYITELKEVLGKNRTCQTWKKGFLEVLNYLLQNKKMVLNTYNSLDRDILENHLYSEIFNIILEVVNELSKGLIVSEEDKNYVAKFYKILFTGIIIDWIKNNMDEDTEELVNNFDKIINGDIYRALLKYEKKEVI
ncbi:TetR/AcrR family transcriptional regulator [Clostridium grantii]|uniref:Transcriptional regulator, TetR family n=1 Tax=Clostridium grantii DSM 8605 TaxID=1121316 RepID=A0A1M5XLY3_9CLOT|nr:TetR/AcrR family transcriptional regulator [Clostridium grantii]SHI00756.1 transcriptional regulator, TetR family [Clostridium grantii DSM 8605]